VEKSESHYAECGVFSAHLGIYALNLEGNARALKFYLAESDIFCRCVDGSPRQITVEGGTPVKSMRLSDSQRRDRHIVKALSI